MKKYGYIPDFGDFRDFVYAAPPGLSIPERIDNFNAIIPIYDQGQLGSCTSFGAGSTYLHAHLKEGKPFFNPAHLQLYYNGRVIENTIKQDSGCQIRDVIKVLVSTGVADENLWPYNIAKFKNKPTAKVYLSASKNKAIEYYRVDNTKLLDIKSALTEGYCIDIGFSVYSEFESDLVGKTGIVPMPGKSSKLLGGHCVRLDGFDEKSQRFICTNSWSASWGIKGRFTIPYAYLTNSNLATDFWILKVVG